MLEKLRCKGLKSKDLTKHVKLYKLLCEDQETVKRKIEITQSLFQDKIFKKYIEDTYDLDRNGYLTTEEIISVTDINVDSLGISSLEGIDLFSGNLEILSCCDNSLGSLGILNFPELKKLDCSGNHKLNHLFCCGCSVEELNIQDCDNLTKLECFSNMITELDLNGHNKLRTLSASYNKLTQVDLSECPNIELVQLGGNDIQSVLVVDEKSIQMIFGVDKSKIFVIEN